MVHIVYIKVGIKWSVTAKFITKRHAIAYKNDLIKRNIYNKNEVKIITKEKEYLN